MVHLRKKNRKLVFLAGLLIITIIFSFYHLYLLDYFETTTRKPRHIIRFGCILLVYSTGLLTLRKRYPPWLIRIWHLLYAALLLILLTIGAYFWCFGTMTTQLHDIAISLTEFALSPAPFVIMALITQSIRTNTTP
jgi:hypothetical protein